MYFSRLSQSPSLWGSSQTASIKFRERLTWQTALVPVTSQVIPIYGKIIQSLENCLFHIQRDTWHHSHIFPTTIHKLNSNPCRWDKLSPHDFVVCQSLFWRIRRQLEAICTKIINWWDTKWSYPEQTLHVLCVWLLLGVDITKRVDDSIHGIFMDPTARHIIVCMKSQESFYLARNSKKPKPLAKMKVYKDMNIIIIIFINITIKYINPNAVSEHLWNGNFIELQYWICEA